MRILENVFFVTMTILFAPVYFLTNWYDNYANRTRKDE
jgi:hypothetical protein